MWNFVKAIFLCFCALHSDPLATLLTKRKVKSQVSPSLHGQLHLSSYLLKASSRADFSWKWNWADSRPQHRIRTTEGFSKILFFLTPFWQREKFMFIFEAVVWCRLQEFWHFNTACKFRSLFICWWIYLGFHFTPINAGRSAILILCFYSWIPYKQKLSLWQASSVQFCRSVAQSLSHVRPFATPWITARQASLSITNCWSSPKFMIIESVIPSSHLILRRPLFLLPPIPPSIRVFSNESTLRMRWQKYWSFSLASCLPKNTPDWSPLGWTGWISLQSKGLSRVFSNTTVQKHQFFSTQLSSQSNFHIHTWLLEKP